MNRRIPITEEQVPCACGRSTSGFCTGLHNLTQDEYNQYLARPMPWEESTGSAAAWPDNPVEG